MPAWRGLTKDKDTMVLALVGPSSSGGCRTALVPPHPLGHEHILIAVRGRSRTGKDNGSRGRSAPGEDMSVARHTAAVGLPAALQQADQPRAAAEAGDAAHGATTVPGGERTVPGRGAASGTQRRTACRWPGVAIPLIMSSASGLVVKSNVAIVGPRV